MLPQMARFTFFYGWIICHYTHTHTHTHTHTNLYHIFFIHSSIYPWTLRLLPSMTKFLILEVIFGSFPNILAIYDTLLLFTHIFDTFTGITLKLMANFYKHLFYIIHEIISIPEILWHLSHDFLLMVTHFTIFKNFCHFMLVSLAKSIK